MAARPRKSAPPPRRNSSRYRFWKRRIRFSTLVVGVVLSSLFTFLGTTYFLLHLRGPSRGQNYAVALPGDASLDTVINQLSAHGVLRYPQLFRWYARLRGVPDHFRSGEVWFSDDMSAEQVARRLSTHLGRARVRVNFPEGWNRFEMADRLARWRVVEREAFLSATVDAALLRSLAIESESAEGYLFPATYVFEEQSDARDLVARLVATFRARFRDLSVRYPQDFAEVQRNGTTELDVVRMASVVEEEAGIASEQATIAGVFYNRLRSTTFLPRARLQSDPTVKYGCLVEPENPVCNLSSITRAMLDDSNNRYNSYRHAGLPPTPITNPGESALLAALRPQQHNYLYFVARGNSRHAFATTLEEHNRNVAAYRASLNRP